MICPQSYTSLRGAVALPVGANASLRSLRRRIWDTATFWNRHKSASYSYSHNYSYSIVTGRKANVQSQSRETRYIAISGAERMRRSALLAAQ